ncbi:MAG: hypothetical protein LC650_00715 [Actinobacteria bacterium]|nr:hypothetical protein [Actinomycetota bacterium]
MPDMFDELGFGAKPSRWDAERDDDFGDDTEDDFEDEWFPEEDENEDL